MKWLGLVGSIKLQVSFAEYRLFYRALLQKRPIILSILLTKATPYENVSSYNDYHAPGKNSQKSALQFFLQIPSSSFWESLRIFPLMIITVPICYKFSDSTVPLCNMVDLAVSGLLRIWENFYPHDDYHVHMVEILKKQIAAKLTVWKPP